MFVVTDERIWLRGIAERIFILVVAGTMHFAKIDAGDVVIDILLVEGLFTLLQSAKMG
jgi:hypothetical protein